MNIKGAGEKVPNETRPEVSYRQICNLPEYKQTTGLQIRLYDNGCCYTITAAVIQ